MSDATPNYRVEQQRIRAQIASLEATKERQKLEVLEMAERVEKNRENIAATNRAIDELRKKLLDLETAHGKLDPELG